MALYTLLYVLVMVLRAIIVVYKPAILSALLQLLYSWREYGSGSTKIMVAMNL